jgi:hypothetical protein
LSNAESKRPIITLDFDEADKDILGPKADPLAQSISNRLVERFLLGDCSALTQRHLYNDGVRGPLDL